MPNYTQRDKFKLPVNDKNCLEETVEDGIFIKQCRNKKKYGNYCFKHRKESNNENS